MVSNERQGFGGGLYEQMNRIYHPPFPGEVSELGIKKLTFTVNFPSTTMDDMQMRSKVRSCDMQMRSKVN